MPADRRVRTIGTATRRAFFGNSEEVHSASRGMAVCGQDHPHQPLPSIAVVPMATMRNNTMPRSTTENPSTPTAAPKAWSVSVGMSKRRTLSPPTRANGRKRTTAAWTRAAMRRLASHTCCPAGSRRDAGGSLTLRFRPPLAHAVHVGEHLPDPLPSELRTERGHPVGPASADRFEHRVVRLAVLEVGREVGPDAALKLFSVAPGAILPEDDLPLGERLRIALVRVLVAERELRLLFAFLLRLQDPVLGPAADLRRVGRDVIEAPCDQGEKDDQKSAGDAVVPLQIPVLFAHRPPS